MGEQRVIIVTGGASGIGRATAVKFARAGDQVVIGDIDERGAMETLTAVDQSGGSARFIRTDVTHYADLESLVAATVADYGRLDVMFNNAGLVRPGAFVDGDLADYHQMIDVCQHGVAYGIRAAARAMRALGKPGTIINTASVFGFVVNRGTLGYHAAKGAVIMITKAAALELAHCGIRVLAIAPGGVDTPILQPVKDAGLIDLVQKFHMRGKLLKAAEIADAVYLLAMPEAGVINGSVVMLDDGFTAFKL